MHGNHFSALHILIQNNKQLNAYPKDEWFSLWDLLTCITLDKLVI